MRKIFLDIKTRIAEIVGLVGGFFWARKTNWDYEPTILFTISLTSILITIIIYFFTKNPKISESVKIPDPKTGNRNRFKNNISSDLFEAKAIQEEIKRTSPYLREQVQASYIGLGVEWEVSFHTIWKNAGSEYYVTTRYKDGYPWVYFIIDIDKYPIFKIAKDGHHFMISGKIVGIDGNTFTIQIDNIIDLD